MQTGQEVGEDGADHSEIFLMAEEEVALLQDDLVTGRQQLLWREREFLGAMQAGSHNEDGCWTDPNRLFVPRGMIWNQLM